MKSKLRSKKPNNAEPVNELPKYARWEHERKFLIPFNISRQWAQAAPWEISDLYLDEGRLRLRSITDTATGENTFKLCKKFPSESAYSQAIVNIYLSRIEYEFLQKLPGQYIEKQRFHDPFQGRVFGIDVFQAELDGLILCEIEADSLCDLMLIEFPPYAQIEVTEDSYFTGGNLSQSSANDLSSRLSTLLYDSVPCRPTKR